MYRKFLNFLLKDLKLGQSSLLVLNFITILILILVVNFRGLVPFSLPASKTLGFSLNLSLILFLRIMALWVPGFNFFGGHLLDFGLKTKILIFFIRVIELARLSVRPITLAVRLIANIIVGHLMLTIANCSMLLLIVGQVLFILELVVCFIQAYVFRKLSAQYFRDIPAERVRI